MRSPPRAVIAIGGNALIAEDQLGTIDEQFGNARRAARHVASLADGEFPEGSMGPKVGAAIEFLERGGKEVVITSLDYLEDAVACATGTHLVAK